MYCVIDRTLAVRQWQQVELGAIVAPKTAAAKWRDAESVLLDASAAVDRIVSALPPSDMYLFGRATGFARNRTPLAVRSLESALLQRLMSASERDGHEVFRVDSLAVGRLFNLKVSSSRQGAPDAYVFKTN